MDGGSARGDARGLDETQAGASPERAATTDAGRPRGEQSDDRVEQSDDRVDRSTSTRSLVLFAIGLLAVPLGLILLYLAATRGESTPRPAVKPGAEAAPSSYTREQLDGQWSLLPGAASNVGYAIDETLVGAAVHTVEATTPAVETGFVIRGGRLEATITQADLRELGSDDAERDRVLSTEGLETDRFPLARFRSTSSAELPATIAVGQPVTITVVGELTLHGVTRPLTLDLTATVRSEDQVEIDVTGTGTIRLAEFGIERPTRAGVLSIAEEGRLQVKLQLARRTTVVTIDRGITGTNGTTPG